MLVILDRSHHPGVVDGVVSDGDTDEAATICGAVARAVIEDVQILGWEELRVVAEPDRQEYRLVADDGQSGAALVRPARRAPVAPRLPEAVKVLGQPMDDVRARLWDLHAQCLPGDSHVKVKVAWKQATRVTRPCCRST